jgi:hemerythrin
MALIEWDPAWSVHNAVIDYDHTMLVNITNEINDLKLKRNTKNADIARMLSQLADYTVKHFNREEKMFENTEYPHIEAHKKRHAELKKTVKEVVDLFSREPDLLNFDEVMTFLKNWLINHIARHDKEYVDYIK